MYIGIGINPLWGRVRFKTQLWAAPKFSTVYLLYEDKNKFRVGRLHYFLDVKIFVYHSEYSRLEQEILENATELKI